LEVSEENIKAVSYFVDNGGIFTIATGRMELGTRKYLEVLPVNAPVIYTTVPLYMILIKKKEFGPVVSDRI